MKTFTLLKSFGILFLLMVSVNSFGQWAYYGNTILGEGNYDHFGSAISLNEDGSIMAVGAYQNNGSASNSGNVKVYECSTGIWQMLGQELNGEDENDYFGYSVSLNDEGNILAVGAYGEDENGSNSGTVRVFINIENNWQQIGETILGDTTENIFGFSISLNGMGNILAIGAIHNSENGSYSGQVKVFENISENWEQIGGDLYGVSAGDYFGYSVSLNSTGNIVSVGAPYNDESGTDSGEVKIFENIDNAWQQIGVDLNHGLAGDKFGKSVSINADGSILAVGAYHNNDFGSNSGKVLVFENSFGTWEQIGSDLTNGIQESQFGISVSINGVGNVVAVGGANTSFFHSVGRVSLYHFSNNEWDRIGGTFNGSNWTLWGWPISLSKVGNKIAIGARKFDFISITKPERGMVKTAEYSYESIINLNLGNDTSICDNSELILNAGYAEHYLWNTGETTQFITVSDSGLYFVNVSSIDSSNTDSIYIGLNESPVVNLGNDTLICPENSYYLEAGIHDSYIWNTGSEEQNILPSLEGHYSVTVSNAYNCSSTDSVYISHSIVNTGLEDTIHACFNSDITIVANNENSNLWNEAINTNQINYVVTQDSLFYLKAIDSLNCMFQDSTYVQVSYDFPFTLGNDTVICSNSQLTLDAGAGFFYLWSTLENSQTITVSDSGYYHVTVSNLGCSVKDSIHIGHYIMPIFELEDRLICSHDTVVLHAGEFESYIWNTGSDSDSISVSTEGLYSVTVTDENNCIVEDDLNVEYIEVVTGINEYLYVPLGTVLTLTANPENINIWNNEIYANAIDYLTTNDTIFYLQATDMNACTVLDSVMIFSNPDINYNCEGTNFDCHNDYSLNPLIEDILIGDNISVSNITINTTDPTVIGYFCNPGDPTFGLDAGIVFSTGNILDLPGAASDFAGSTIGSGSDPDLSNISDGYTINDAVVIEFDYIPYTNIMSFSYIFGSEEFPEFVGSFNDAFGFFLAGAGADGMSNYVSENIALLPNGQAVTINNVFPTDSYYDNQGNNGQSVVLDGYTLPLDAVVEVVPFTTYHIKLAVGDAGDSSYDTGVFLSNNSFNAWPLQYSLSSENTQSLSPNTTTIAIEDSSSITIEIELPIVAQTDITYHYSILGTAENGVDYETIADSITFPEDSIRATIDIIALADNLYEPLENIIIVMDFLNDTIIVDLLSLDLPSDTTEIIPDTLLFVNPNLYDGIDEHIVLELEICDLDLQEVDSAMVSSYVYINDTITNYTIQLYSNGEYSEYLYTFNNQTQSVYELEIYVYCSTIDSNNTVIKIVDYIDTDIFTNIKNLYKSNISIYPNPALKAFTVQNDNYKGKSYTINCYSSIGVLLYSKVVDSDKTSIEISHWAEGIYIIEVDREKFKFIKK